MADAKSTGQCPAYIPNPDASAMTLADALALELDQLRYTVVGMSVAMNPDHWEERLLSDEVVAITLGGVADRLELAAKAVGALLNKARAEGAADARQGA